MLRHNPYRNLSGDPIPAVARLIRFPAYVLWTLWGFVVSWCETRRYRYLWQGLPAVCLAALLVMLLLWQGRPASSEMVVSYREKARQATSREEFELAEFYFRKLEQLAPGDIQTRYDHALLYDAQEEYGHAALVMQSLVRDDNQSDDVKVHLWLARSALEGRLGIENPLAFAKEHLNQVLEDEPDDRYAHFFFFQLFLRLNDLENAIRHLEPVASQLPELQLQLATLYRLQGDRKRSLSLAREAASLLEKEIDEKQTADVNKWLRLAGCYLLLEDYPQAVNRLKQAVTKFDDEACRKSLGRTYVRWSDAVIKRSPGDIGLRMQLLQEALQVAPDDTLALRRIVDIAKSEGPAAEDAQARLKEALAEGNATAVIHFALGTIAAGAGDMEAALHHLDQADAINPRTAVTLNNLAFVLIHLDPPDLERALEVSNQAVRLAEKVSQFRETRGQILTLLGRHQAAITDLEFALPGTTIPATRINIHQSLCTCYEQMGDADLARIHQEKADKLAAEFPVVDRAGGEGTDPLMLPELNLDDPPEIETSPVQPVSDDIFE